MLDRSSAVRILLASRLDWAPPVKLASTYAPESGPAGGDRVRCGRCAATGRVIGTGLTAQPCPACRQAKRRADETNHRFTAGCSRCRPCVACEHGWRHIQPGYRDDDGNWVSERTPPLFPGETGDDEYLRPGKNELHEDALTRSETRRRLDTLIDALDDQAAAREGRAEDLRPYGWERDRDAHYRAGSYAELDRLLEELRDRYPVLAWAVLTVYVYEPHHGVRDLLDRSSLVRVAGAGLDWVAARMPELIRVPPWLLPERDAAARKESLWRGRGEQVRQREQRDDEIRRLSASLSVEDLGRRFALGRSQVYAILADSQVASGPAA
jgi:hypothetical protein